MSSSGLPGWLTRHLAGLRMRVLAAVLMVAVPVIGLLVFLNLQQQHAEIRRISQNARYLAQLAALNQQRVIESAHHLLIAMARRFEVTRELGLCNQSLALLLERYGGRYTNLGLLDTEGNVLCSGAPGPLRNASDRDYFIEAMATRDFAVSGYLVGRRSGIPVLIFALPALGPDGTVQGVFYAGMDLQNLNQSFSADDWADVTLTITDRNNRVVARMPDGGRWLGQELPADDVTDQLALANDGVVEMDIDGEPHLVGFSTVSPTNSGLVARVSVNRNVAVAQARRSMLQGLLVVGVLSAFAIGIGIAASNRLILQPLADLTHASRRLASGDLSTRAAASTSIPELRELGRAFDEMAASLEMRQIASEKAELERRALEERIRQQQKMEAIGQLAGGIAHDFNNLLTIVIGHAEILASELPPDTPHQADVREIGQAAARAASLTRQLLAFGRRQILLPAAVDLGESVEEMAVMLRRLLGEHIVIEVKRPPDLGHVRADPSQLEQILLNLSINARDAMPQGGTLTLSMWNETVEGQASQQQDLAPGDYVVLAVTDTGVGMDEATRARVFEPFFTTKDVGKGTGLGLSTVYGIVQQSGGHITVESAPGRGSTFTVYLPRAGSRPEDGTPPPPAGSHSKGTRGGRTVARDAGGKSPVRPTDGIGGYPAAM